MSISDELREFASHCAGGMGGDSLRHIADRIDEEYQKAIRELNSLADASVLLPVDADGVPIHIGDTMHGTCPSGKYVCGEVLAIGDSEFWLRNVQFSLRPSYMRHYHEPTVKDMLQELVIDWDCAPDGEEKTAVLKHYAAKLRLANDGKEQ